MSLIVIGATSEIGQSTAKIFFGAGHDLLLIARDINLLRERYPKESGIGPSVDISQGCIDDLKSTKSLAETVIGSLRSDPYVLIAIGSIQNETLSRVSSDSATYIIDVNFRNLVALITPIAEALRERREGCLIILSSVAGDRGRQSNYVYGSAKAGLSTYTQGLRSRLVLDGVHVLTVKPGYVDTAMLREALGEAYRKIPRFLVGDLDRVGDQIFQAAMKKKNVIYARPIWRFVMFFVRLIPENIFKRLNL